jgi:hypothetical protein
MGFFDMFNSAIKEERKAVKEAKASLKELVSERNRSLKDAESALKTSTKEYDSARSAARGHLESLRNPPKGKRIDDLGQVTLYRHFVSVGRRNIPLAGLSVRVESGPTSSYIYFDPPDGRTEMASFSTELRDVKAREDASGNVWVDQKRDFTDAQVRTLAAEIQRAINAETQFQQQLPQLIAAAEADVAEKEAATGPVEAAQADLDRLIAEHPLTASIKAAEAALAEAEQALTEAKVK